MRAGIAVAIVAVALTGCGKENPPCESLDAPTGAMRQATIEGAEVEIEVETPRGNKAECVVVVVGNTARWADQTDDV